MYEIYSLDNFHISFMRILVPLVFESAAHANIYISGKSTYIIGKYLKHIAADLGSLNMNECPDIQPDGLTKCVIEELRAKKTISSRLHGLGGGAFVFSISQHKRGKNI